MAGEHALWREAAKDLGATLGSNLRNQFASGADRHRGFKDHQQVVVRAGDQRFGRANECLVGDAPVVANEYGHNNKGDVGITHRGGAVDGGAQSARANVLGKKFRKVRLAAPWRDARVDDVDECLIDVDGMHAPTVGGELQGEREADLAGADDGDGADGARGTDPWLRSNGGAVGAGVWFSGKGATEHGRCSTEWVCGACAHCPSLFPWRGCYTAAIASRFGRTGTPPPRADSRTASARITARAPS